MHLRWTVGLDGKDGRSKPCIPYNPERSHCVFGWRENFIKIFSCLTFDSTTDQALPVGLLLSIEFHRTSEHFASWWRKHFFTCSDLTEQRNCNCAQMCIYKEVYPTRDSCSTFRNSSPAPKLFLIVKISVNVTSGRFSRREGLHHSKIKSSSHLYLMLKQVRWHSANPKRCKVLK